VIPGKKYTPEDVFEAAWRRKWLIAIPFVLIAIATGLYTRRMPSLYRSQALIQVIPPTVQDNYLRATVQTRLEERLSSIGHLVMNRSQLEKIVRDFNLYNQRTSPVPIETLIDRMSRDITFNVADREVLRLGYTTGEPETAFRVAERLTSLFIDSSSRDREDQANKARDFFQTELERAKASLVEQEKKLEEFRLQYAGQLPSQQEANLGVLSNTQAQLQTIQTEINRDRDQRNYLERQRDQANNVDAPVAPTPTSTATVTDAASLAGGTVLEQLETARTSLRTMELRLTPEHPDIMAMKRTIDRLEKKAAAEAPRTANGRSRPVKSQAELQRENRNRELAASIDLIDRQIRNKQAEEQRLKATIEEYKERIDAAPRRESELTALTRDYETVQKLYTGLLQKKEDANIAANLEKREIGERFKVIDPPRQPRSPVSPNRPRLLILGMIGGLVIGAGMAAFFEYRDSSVRTDDDVAASLALPVLATIPVLDAGRTWRKTT
jgi:polysaccharide chain length determinant protein (PEP-CTERM system associated)